MIAHAYVVDEETGVLLDGGLSACPEITPELVAVCEKALEDPAVIEGTGCGLRVRWTAGPGCLSCWVDEVPVATALFLRSPKEKHALHALCENARLITRGAGTFDLDQWEKHVVSFPCVVTLPLPFGTAQARQIAGELIQAWAIAYFEVASTD